MFNATKESPQNIKDNTMHDMREVRDDLRDVANRTGRKVRSFVDSASEEISEVSGTLNRQIHDKPMQSTLLALGAGFLLGALFRK